MLVINMAQLKLPGTERGATAENAVTAQMEDTLGPVPPSATGKFTPYCWLWLPEIVKIRRQILPEGRFCIVLARGVVPCRDSNNQKVYTSV